DGSERARLLSRWQRCVVDRYRKVEGPVLCHGLDALGGPIALLVKVGFALALGSAGDHRNEKTTVTAHGVLEIVLEVVADGEPLGIEPDEAAASAQFFDDSEGGRSIAWRMGVADEDRAVGRRPFHERDLEVRAGGDSGGDGRL